MDTPKNYDEAFTEANEAVKALKELRFLHRITRGYIKAEVSDMEYFLLTTKWEERFCWRSQKTEGNK